MPEPVTGPYACCSRLRGHNNLATRFGVRSMIRASDMRQRILEHPFRPFRVYLTDGRHFDIHDPTWNVVGEPVFLIGVAPDHPRSRYPDRHEWVPYELIDKVEALPAATAAR